MPRTGPRWMRFMRWVVNPDILLRRRLDGTTACFWMVGEWVNGMEEGKQKTHDFIDNSLVGVEIKRKAGVAVVQVMISFFYVFFILLNDTHYFSIKTREALLVVLVRTRPYIRSFSL